MLRIQDIQYPITFTSKDTGKITYVSPTQGKWNDGSDYTSLPIRHFVAAHNAHNHKSGDYSYTMAEPDDELPPVPESALYLNPSARRKLLLRVKEEGLSLLVYSTTTTQCFGGIGLDAETALDLAADLTRMALKLKREQEKDG